MKLKTPSIEPALIFLMSFGLLAVSVPRILYSILLSFPQDIQFFEDRVGLLSNLLLTYVLALLVLAVVSYRYSLKGDTLVSRLLKHCRDVASVLRNELIPSVRHCFASGNEATWFIYALCIGLGLRGYFLSQPMRYDEAYTFLNFVNKTFLHLFFYPLPNNHVLHSILVKFSTLIWGAHPASIRLPAFLAGVGSVLLMFCLCRSLKLSGVMAAFAAAVCPYLVLYSTNARGYSLLVLLTLGLALIGLNNTKKPSLAGATLISSTAAVGMLTIPSMLFPITGIYLWLVCLLFLEGHAFKTILTRFLIPIGIMFPAFTLFLYSPVIFVSGGVESIVANGFVRPQPWPEFLGQSWPHFQRTYSDFTRDLPRSIQLTGVLLVILGIYRALKMRSWALLLILPSILLGSLLVFFVKQKIPFPRTWIYIIPIVVLVADAGFTHIIEKVAPQMRKFIMVAVLGLSSVMAVFLISKDKITHYSDTGTFPEAQIVAKYLKPILQPGDSVGARNPADWTTRFYFWYHGVPDPKAAVDPESRKRFLVVQNKRSKVMDMTDKPVTKLLDLANMALYQVDDADDR